MPIQFNDLDLDSTGFKGFEAELELDSPTFIEGLEFYPSASASPTTDPSPTDIFFSEAPAMGSTSAALVSAGEYSWCKVEDTDEESYPSMSSDHDPFIFSDRICLDFDGCGADNDSLTADDVKGFMELKHDCMVSGDCMKCDNAGSRTLNGQASTCANGLSCNSASDNSNSSASGSGCGGIGNTSDNLRTGLPSISLIQSRNITSGSGSKINNSFGNGSANSSSFNSQTGMNNGSGSSVVKTIEVPSECGPVIRTGVIVQKTVGRSLLIKSRTKSDNNCTAGNQNAIAVCGAGNGSVDNNTGGNNSSNSLSSGLSPAIKSNNSRNSMISGIPTPPLSDSRPETPQSLSESEEDSCQFDLNFCNIDNLKPPRGDLWDEIIAAVEQEHADGMFDITSSGNSGGGANDSDNKLGLTTSDIDILSSFGLIEDLLTPTPKVARPSNRPIPSDGGPYGKVILRDNLLSAATTVINDHSYDKHSSLRFEDLGVQTPSDSEEEVDVVSLFDRSRTSSRSSSASSRSSSAGLPTNPSAQDQEKIQVITTSKLLNAASKAVSRRLRSKVTGKGKALGSGSKRRPSSDLDEYTTTTTTTTRLNKKPRLYYKPKSRFAADSESDSKEKRDMHNNMERMRRIDLRNSFEELKALVPTLLVKERAPKVQILQEAASYCTELKFESRKLATQVAALRKEQERLRGTVSGLRRSLAAHR